MGIGSNCQPRTNLKIGAVELANRFHLLATSSVYRNKAFGFEGADFLNAVVCVESEMSPGDIYQQLEEIHTLAGRQRDFDAFLSRTLDIDLLLYDGLIIDAPPIRVPRSDVLDYSFVLGPLAEIAPDYIHPISRKTIAWHWSSFDVDAHPLVRVNLIL